MGLPVPTTGEAYVCVYVCQYLRGKVCACVGVRVCAGKVCACVGVRVCVTRVASVHVWVFGCGVHVRVWVCGACVCLVLSMSSGPSQS